MDECYLSRIEFGEHVREIRQKKNIPIKALAIEMQCTTTYVSKIESGVNYPSMDKFFPMCKALGVSPAEFFYVIDSSTERYRKAAISANIRQADHCIKALKRLLASDYINVD